MLKGLVGFEKDKVVHSSKMVVPFLVFFLMVMIENSAAGPKKILAQYSILSLAIFMVMISVGLIYNDIKTPMIDQAVIVKLKNKGHYYLAKVVVIIIIGLILTAIGLGIPNFMNLANGGHSFVRPVVLMDNVSGFFLLFFAAVCGGISGLTFNRKIIARRGNAILSVTLLGLISVIKVALVRDVPFLKYVTWMLPPVSDISVSYSKENWFNFSNVGLLMLWLVAYIMVITFLYIVSMKNKGFD